MFDKKTGTSDLVGGGLIIVNDQIIAWTDNSAWTPPPEKVGLQNKKIPKSEPQTNKHKVSVAQASSPTMCKMGSRSRGPKIRGY